MYIGHLNQAGTKNQFKQHLFDDDLCAHYQRNNDLLPSFPCAFPCCKKGSADYGLNPRSQSRDHGLQCDALRHRRPAGALRLPAVSDLQSPQHPRQAGMPKTEGLPLQMEPKTPTHVQQWDLLWNCLFGWIVVLFFVTANFDTFYQGMVSKSSTCLFLVGHFPPTILKPYPFRPISRGRHPASISRPLSPSLSGCCVIAAL